MSNSLRKYVDSHYPKYRNDKHESSKMHVNAFVGGEKYGHGVQFTMDDSYFRLSGEQARDLIEVLEKRLACEDGHGATDPDHVEKTINSDGERREIRWE